MNGIEKSKSTSGSPVTTSPGPRTCKAPDCKRTLVHNNRTGFCTDHGSLAKRRGHATNDRGGPTLVTKPNSKANGAVISKANDHNGNGVDKTNAHENSHALAIDERVNLVLSGLPLDEKLRMISLWLHTG